MNPFVSRITHNQAWVVPVSALSLVLGFMIVQVAMSPAIGQLRFRDPDIRNRQFQQASASAQDAQTQGELKAKSIEISKLRAENTKLQNTLVASGEQSKTIKVLNDSLQEVKFYAGLTAVTGPGVMVTLKDGYSASDRKEPKAEDPSVLPVENVIHDQDILRVVNELYAAGAEAVSINNLRLVSTSSVRCVGPTVLIDSVRISSPIVIRAVGDPGTLKGALDLPGGIIDELKEVNPRMVDVETVKSLTLPAFTGPTSRSYAKVVTDSK